MNFEVVNLILFLGAALLFSVFWGFVTRFSARSHRVTQTARFLMRFSKNSQDALRAYLIWAIYLLTGLAGSALLLIIFRISLSPYLGLRWSDLAYTFLGLVAQTALASLTLFIVGSFFRRLNWSSVMMSIPWTRVMQLMPRGIGFLYPTSGALCEEFFFRGAIFLILILRFPWLNVWAAIAIAAALFTMQQYLNTASPWQGFTISVGALAISVVACLLILVTGSFLSALLCHELYIIFYLGQGKPSGKAAPRAGGNFFDQDKGVAY